MRYALRTLAVLFWLVAAFLLYAVINAVASDEGARVGVAVGYVAGAIVLSVVSLFLWKGRVRAPRSA